MQFSLSDGRGETNLALVFDSGHYQETANLIRRAVAEHRVGSELMANLNLDGPVLPGLGALSIAAFGRAFSLADWRCLLGVQYILHGLGAALICLLLNEICPGSRKCALTAGLVWAFNPVAVLAGQRFLAENLAADLVLLLLLLSCRALERVVRLRFLLWLGTGLCAGAILFVKTGLAPAVALVLVLALVYSIGDRQSVRWNQLLAMLLAWIIGLSAFVLPWAILTASVGKMELFPQRAPVLNLFVGWNFENDGLSTLPVAPYPSFLQKEYEHSGSPAQAVLKLWLHEPVASLKLTAKKIVRLYSLPWNDFRRSCLFLSPLMMQFLHLTVLAIALCGFFALVVGRRGPRAVWFSLVLFAGHFIFVLFEAVPRYAFSSYALLFLAAIWYLRLVWVKARGDGEEQFLTKAASAAARQRLAFHYARIIVPAAAVALFCIVLCRLGVSSEWQSRLDAGAQAERLFDWPDAAPGQGAFVLIDGTRQIADCRLTVNGQEVQGRPVSLTSLFPERLEGLVFARQVVAFMGRSDADLRQWWVMALPPDIAIKARSNSIKLTAPTSGSIKLAGEYSGAALSRPGYLYYSPGKIWTSNDSFEWREGRAFSDRALSGQSLLNGQPLKQKGNWRLFLVAGESRDLGRLLQSGAVN
ncbi:MAG: hypothetical protein JSS83_13765 [Cyanobacteria bacterium SZAS LIN-3]|nr:hypothetical protein [Cyanobacteria bacterium SZAS LIN-3]